MERLHGLINPRDLSLPGRIVVLLVLLLFWSGCREETKQTPQQTEPPQARVGGCQGCHAGVDLDNHHTMSCDACHGGDPQADSRDAAHVGLVGRPSQPQHAARACGPCHQALVDACSTSTHYSLPNEINQVRRHFGLPEVDGPQDLQVSPGDDTLPALVDDLLRRHCLRCHVHDPGDAYPATRHGLGCAACHLERGAGRQTSHRFLRHPGDRQCLACHRGAYVGAEYHGMAERDTTIEYRTPYAGPGAGRDFGIEQHRLGADVHQQAGIACIDCHGGAELMAAGAARPTPVSCRGCHDRRPGQPAAILPDGLSWSGSTLRLATKLSKRSLVVPQLRHPAHARFADTVDCAVCHAQRGGNDQTTHLLRQEGGDFSSWFEQTVQGNAEVERFLTRTEAGKKDAAASRDKFTAEVRPGIWLQSYGQRRWEDIIIRPDQDGRLRVFRPLLDLRLSALDEAGRPLADNITGQDDGYRPFTPHNIGPAGPFFVQRLRAGHTPKPGGKESTP